MLYLPFNVYLDSKRASKHTHRSSFINMTNVVPFLTSYQYHCHGWCYDKEINSTKCLVFIFSFSIMTFCWPYHINSISIMFLPCPPRASVATQDCFITTVLLNHTQSLIHLLIFAVSAIHLPRFHRRWAKRNRIGETESDRALWSSRWNDSFKRWEPGDFNGIQEADSRTVSWIFSASN